MKRGIIKIVIAGVIVVAVAVTVTLTFQGRSRRQAEVAQGVEVLKKMESADVTQVESKIRQIEEEELKNDEEYQNRPLNVKYDGSLIMGDSQAEALTAYSILDDSEVIARKGMHLKDTADDMETAINLNPKNIFLTYGVNDLGMYSTKDDFIAVYKEIISHLQENLPDTKIYVNLIFPVQQSAINQQPYLARYDEFNEGIRSMCDELGVTCIDSNSLVKDECYEPDGIHMNYNFYLSWVEYMAEAAQL